MKLLAATLIAPLAFAAVKPPNAWVITSTGRHQLGSSSSCWMSGMQMVCGDFAAPTCTKGPAAAPKVLVRRGERIRFELGFDPKSVSVIVGHETAQDLAATRHPAWRATRSGPLILFADAKHNGDASYVACIVFRR